MNADEIARILDELGRRLGPTGEYVFSLAVRQVVIDGVLSIILLAVVTVASLLAGRYVMRQYRACNCSYSCGWEMIGVVVGLCSVTVIALAGWSACYGLSRLLNPEYAALRDILGAIVP